MAQPLPITTEPVIPPSILPVRKFNPVFLLAVLVLLLVFGVSGFLLGNSTGNSQNSAQPTVALLPTQIPTPTFDETTNWKTYADTAMRIEFKYPSQFKIKMETSNGDEVFIRLLKLTRQVGKEDKTISALNYYNNPENLTLEKFENKLMLEDQSGEHLKVYLPEDKKITLSSGESAYFRKDGFWEPLTCDLYIFPRNQKIYIWARYLQQTDHGTEFYQEDYFDQILSTFKFTSP